MAQTITVNNRNKQSPIISIAIILAGLIGGYIYYSQTPVETSPIQTVSISADDNLSKFKDLKFDFSILDDARFQALKIFGESPVLPGSTGRTDIFAPF